LPLESKKGGRTGTEPVYGRIRIKGGLSATHKAIFKDHLVDDLSADHASPSKKMLTISIKFFINHCSPTPHAFHGISLHVEMGFNSDFLLPLTIRGNPSLHHPFLGCHHKDHFTEDRDRVNKVNPVFLDRKSRIFIQNNV
jgi:hypothetical protein